MANDPDITTGSTSGFGGMTDDPEEVVTGTTESDSAGVVDDGEDLVTRLGDKFRSYTGKNTGYGSKLPILRVQCR